MFSWTGTWDVILSPCASQLSKLTCASSSICWSGFVLALLIYLWWFFVVVCLFTCGFLFFKISMWNSAGKLSYSWRWDMECLKRAFPFNCCVVLHPQSRAVKSELQEDLWQPARLLSSLCPCPCMHMLARTCMYTSCFDKVEKMVWTHPFQCEVSRHIQTTVNISSNFSTCFTWIGNHVHKLF